VPEIDSIAPNSIIAGTNGLNLTVSAAKFSTSFSNNAVVQWNGQNLATTFVNTSKLLAIVPSSFLQAPGTASVGVFNPGPGGGTSSVLPFTISGATGQPQLISSLPTSLTVGSPNTTIAVSVKNQSTFPSHTLVIRWNGKD